MTGNIKITAVFETVFSDPSATSLEELKAAAEKDSDLIDEFVSSGSFVYEAEALPDFEGDDEEEDD